MSDEHVSPNLGTLWARQRNAFRMVFFWRAESGRFLRAYWELVDQFLSHLLPDPSYGEVPQEIERL